MRGTAERSSAARRTEWIALGLSALALGVGSWFLVPDESAAVAQPNVSSATVVTIFDGNVDLTFSANPDGGTHVSFTAFGSVIPRPGVREATDGIARPNPDDFVSLTMGVPSHAWGVGGCDPMAVSCAALTDQTQAVTYRVPVSGQGMNHFAAEGEFDIPPAQGRGALASTTAGRIAIAVPRVDVTNDAGAASTAGIVSVDFVVAEADNYVWTTEAPLASEDRASWQRSVDQPLSSFTALGAVGGLERTNSARTFAAGALVGLAGGIAVAALEVMLSSRAPSGGMRAPAGFQPPGSGAYGPRSGLISIRKL